MIAAKLMTRDVVTTTPDTLVKDAIGLLRRHHLHDIPVIDAGGRPVGVLTARAILHHALPSYASEDLLAAMQASPDLPSVHERLLAMADLKVSEVMSPRILSVKEHAPTNAIAAMLVLMRNDSQDILVTDGQGRLVGTISALDIIFRDQPR
ncbi:MAG TPA: CBS domain-containing protein [Mariprofundaceae bacterium]|nr:CBS domain-containing protein [Mariprofundaceae bacterium]